MLYVDVFADEDCLIVPIAAVCVTIVFYYCENLFSMVIWIESHIIRPVRDLRESLYSLRVLRSSGYRYCRMSQRMRL